MFDNDTDVTFILSKNRRINNHLLYRNSLFGYVLCCLMFVVSDKYVQSKKLTFDTGCGKYAKKKKILRCYSIFRNCSVTDTLDNC